MPSHPNRNPSQPRCPNCRDPIPKRTINYHIRDGKPPEGQPRGDNDFWVTIFPGKRHRSKDEGKPFSPHKLVSFKYHEVKDDNRKVTDRYVLSFTAWDGHSYNACYDYFCSNNCAAAFGRAAVRNGFKRHDEDYPTLVKQDE